MITVTNYDVLTFKLEGITSEYYLFKYYISTKVRNVYTKKWVKTKEQHYIATWDEDGNGGYNYYIYKGHAMYVYLALKGHLDESSEQYLLNLISNGTLGEDLPQGNLNDTQYSQVCDLLSFKRSIYQTPTGSGKTEVIAHLTKIFLDRGLKVLITAGGQKALDEINHRISENFPEVYVLNYYDSSSQLNSINPNGFVNSSLFNQDCEFLKNVDVVLSDEVELATSNSCWSLYKALLTCENYYGFGATAESLAGKILDLSKGLECLTSLSAKYVTSIFGSTVVYKKPSGYQITLNNVISYGLRGLSFENVNPNSVYKSITDTILLDEEFMRIIDRLVINNPHLFIPINNLDFIDQVCERYKGKYRVATITGAGYWHSENGWTSLDDLKYLSQNNHIDILLASIAGFRALDFRGFRDLLLILGSSGSSVFQFIGRVARHSQFKLHYITLGDNFKLPIYSETTKNQLDLILDYYENCEITHTSEIIY